MQFAAALSKFWIWIFSTLPSRKTRKRQFPASSFTHAPRLRFPLPVGLPPRGRGRGLSKSSLRSVETRHSTASGISSNSYWVASSSTNARSTNIRLYLVRCSRTCLDVASAVSSSEQSRIQRASANLLILIFFGLILFDASVLSEYPEPSTIMSAPALTAFSTISA